MDETQKKTWKIEVNEGERMRAVCPLCEFEALKDEKAAMPMLTNFCPRCGERLIHDVQKMNWRQKKFLALSIRSALEKITQEAFQRHYQHAPEYKELADFLDSMYKRLREEAMQEKDVISAKDE